MSLSDEEDIGLEIAELRHSDPTGERARMVSSLAGILALAVIIGILLPRQSFLGGLEEWSRDLRVAIFTPPESQDEEIVIIGFTDETLDQLTYRLPVDRTLLANIIRRMDEAKARAVGIDFLLDSYTEPEKDADLKEALQNAALPVIPIWADQEVGTVGTRAEILREFVGERPSGYGMLIRDQFDGTVRNHYPYWNPGGEVEWQFPAAMARSLGVEVAKLRQQRIDWHGAPQVTKGEDYTPPFAMYPAHLVEFLPIDWFTNKIILIGPILVDIDIHRTPFSTASWIEDVSRPRSGVEIHAHILSQLLENREQQTLSLPWEIIYVFAMALAGLGLTVLAIPLWSKLTLSATLIAGTTASALALFYNAGFMAPILPPLVAFFIAAALATVYTGRQLRAQRAMIRWAFAHYLPPAVVARLDKDPASLELGGVRQEVTLIFSDLEGFTSLTETMPPAILSSLVNGYLEGIGDTVLAHGGTIDKFLGDGCMGFFGAPEAAEDDALRSILCAQKMVGFSESFRARLQDRGLALGRTRIGIHTGSAIVGNFGGRQRFDYTALGDAVNTTARLEAANKAVGTSVLVSDETVARAQALPHCAVRFRPVGEMLLVGKQIPLMVYTPVDTDDDATSYHLRYAEAYDLINREDEKALGLLTDLAEQRPEDPLVQFYLRRLERGQTGTLITLESK